MSHPDEGERRAEPRVRAEGLLSVMLRYGDQETECHLVDISKHGAYLATSVGLDRGTPVVVTFRLEGEPHEIQAHVARAKTVLDGHHDALPAGIGVRFFANTVEERQRIDGVVAAVVSSDLLSYDRHKSHWMTSTESGGGDRTKPFKS